MESKDRCLYSTHCAELVSLIVAMVLVHRHLNALMKNLFPVCIDLDRRLCSS